MYQAFTPAHPLLVGFIGILATSILLEAAHSSVQPIIVVNAKAKLESLTCTTRNQIYCMSSGKVGKVFYLNRHVLQYVLMVGIGTVQFKFQYLNY